MTDDASGKHYDEVYAKDADYVKLALKRTTAERVAGWLRDAAETYDIGGAETSADHARAVADRIDQEVGDTDD